MNWFRKKENEEKKDSQTDGFDHLALEVNDYDLDENLGDLDQLPRR